MTSGPRFTGLGWASRQYDLALKQFESLGDDWGMMCAYREKQMYPEAMAALEGWKLGHPSQYRHLQVLATAAGICGLEGRKYEAQKLIDELRETARHQYVSGFFFAEAYVGVGQKRPRAHMAGAGLRRSRPMDGVCGRVSGL